MAATDLNTLTYGIEIECCIPNDAMQAKNWTVGRAHRGHPIPGFDGWTAQSDGSIRARYPKIGVEVVSPVLQGAEGIATIRRMLAQLAAMGTTVNRSTGFHVHVGFGGSAAQLRRLICFVSNHERALFAATGSRARERNHFCASIKASHRALAEMRTMTDLINHHMARYHVLNLTNLQSGAKPTVEFRVFAGTLNPTKIEAYVQICLGMVQKSLDASVPVTWDAKPCVRQAKEGIGDGALAVRRLINQLNWWGVGSRKPFGVFTPARVPAMARKLRTLANKYDGPRPAAVVAPVTPEPTR